MNVLCTQARAVLAYHVGDYDQLFHLLASRTYSSSCHDELQALWFAGHYAAMQARILALIVLVISAKEVM